MICYQSGEVVGQASDLGESLNQLLTNLEDLGVDGLPADMEVDLRHVMNLESPTLASRILDLENDDDLDEDLLESFSPFGLSPEDCSQMAQFFTENLSLTASDHHRGEAPGGGFVGSTLLGAEPFILLPNKLSLNEEATIEEIPK